MRYKIFLSLIGLILICPNLFAMQAEVENISSNKYFESALNEINSAKSSVQVVMYLISIIPVTLIFGGILFYELYNYYAIIFT